MPCPPSVYREVDAQLRGVTQRILANGFENRVKSVLTKTIRGEVANFPQSVKSLVDQISRSHGPKLRNYLTTANATVPASVLKMRLKICVLRPLGSVPAAVLPRLDVTAGQRERIRKHARTFRSAIYFGLKREVLGKLKGLLDEFAPLSPAPPPPPPPPVSPGGGKPRPPKPPSRGSLKKSSLPIPIVHRCGFTATSTGRPCRRRTTKLYCYLHLKTAKKAASQFVGKWRLKGEQSAVANSGWRAILVLSANGTLSWKQTTGLNRGAKRTGQWDYDGKRMRMVYRAPEVGLVEWIARSPKPQFMQGDYHTPQTAAGGTDWGGSWSGNKSKS